MDLDLTLIGELMVIAALVMAAISYYLGNRKTRNPKLTALAGFFTVLVPLVAIIYLAVLLLKPDLESNT